MARVLVTGASGFIGSHLVDALLARGDEITALARKTSRLERLRELGLRLAYGDLNDPESLRGAVAGQSTVYHAAGRTRALRAELLYRVNRDGTGNLARACAEQANPSVLVMVSSLAAAGPSPPDRPRTETDPPHPVSQYGRSKRQAEEAAGQFASGVPITVVRPPMVLGEADPNGVALFRAVARTGVHVVPGWSPRTFSVIYAGDLARLIILAAERGRRLAPPGSPDASAAAGCYFAACEERPTYGQLGRMVGTALGRPRVRVLRVPMPLVWLVAAGTEAASHLRRRPLYLMFDKYREVAAGSWVCSPQRAADELGFAVRTPLPERLRQTAEWYRKEGLL